MNDPKNIPLDQARPGDIVHLKPLRLGGVRWAAGRFTVDMYALPTAWIDHIERAPRPLEVGDTVRSLLSGTFGTILAIDGDYAAVRWAHGVHGWPKLTDLERVDG